MANDNQRKSNDNKKDMPDKCSLREVLAALTLLAGCCKNDGKDQTDNRNCKKKTQPECSTRFQYFLVSILIICKIL